MPFSVPGVLAWGRILRRQLDQRKVELAQLKKHEAAVAGQVKLLDPRHVDPDLAEVARKEAASRIPTVVLPSSDCGAEVSARLIFRQKPEGDVALALAARLYGRPEFPFEETIPLG